MHRQQPKMPLFRSTSAANPGYVGSSRARTVYAGQPPEYLILGYVKD